MNGHGDVAQMLAGTTVVKSYNYDAFGNEIGINTADTNPFRYCAQYYDKESGTIYLRARYYAPGLGRFTQQDEWKFAYPSDPLSLNLYTYCVNDPIKYVDYSGNSFEDIYMGVIEAVDQNIFGGLLSGLVTWVNGRTYYYMPDYNKDYSIGKIIGNGATGIIGISEIYHGAGKLVVSFVKGGAITLLTEGGGYQIGAAVAIGDTLVGAVEIAHGVFVLYSSANGIFDATKQFGELKHFYNSIKEAPNYPQGFIASRNGTKKVTVNNKELLEQLRMYEAGEWKKVYKNGYNADGEQISIHYFESKSGKVFNVKVKEGWS